LHELRIICEIQTKEAIVAATHFSSYSGR